jgi:hypothetical protein
MPKKFKKQNIHAERMKVIRPFVSFSFDLRKSLTSYQKVKIKKYFTEINALTARPFQLYRSKNSTRLKTAQSFAQHEVFLRDLKVAFIPSNGEDKLKVNFNSSGELKVKSTHVETSFIELSKWHLVRNPKKHVEKLLKKREEKRFTILCGKYEIPKSLDKKEAADTASNLTKKYDDKDANNYFGNWLIGISAHKFNKQKNYDAYRETKRKSREELKKRRAKEKRAIKKRSKEEDILREAAKIKKRRKKK